MSICIKSIIKNMNLIDTKKPHTWLMTGLGDFSGWKPEWRDTIFVRMAQNHLRKHTNK